MIANNPFRAFTATAWAIAAVLVLALLVLGYCQVTKPSRDAARQAEAQATLSDGRTGAAQDASRVRDGADARQSETDLTVKETTDAIRSAPDDASAGDAGLVGLCRLYPGHDPRCRMLLADPRRVD
jgi:hypothetical protein